ncbi:MAG: phenylalanine--tRNA ligase subunit beta [Oscillospiraceae bacterium]|nr:phenylalanine--tRNA ligase subunit beta [Oscillospiraceae bacterium]
MNLSKKWLSDYVKLNITDSEFAHGMTMSGSKVEAYFSEGGELSNIVAGKILSIEKHPGADSLLVCSVDAGQNEPLQIVTGAKNLTAGDVVPVALHNSCVRDAHGGCGGKKITKGKLRGVESFGMLCSLAELGLTSHDFPCAAEDGIFILGDDCDKTLGLDIKEAVGLNDVVTEFEITPNRPDCLSVTGLAREAAATFGVQFEIKEPKVNKTADDVNNYLKVDINAPDKCYRYAGAVVKNVKIAPSPKWMRERLRASGVRPINNIVDITNYVMLEFGQPMHAFDLRCLDNSHVIVRNAAKGEKITTLDGIERDMTEDMLVIADENRPVAVAGVMGGEYSGIMEDTDTIVFESACFNGTSVRLTSKKLGLRTESSGRFEKGLDREGCLRSLMRALELVELLDCGDIISGAVDVYPSKKEVAAIPFDPDWINNFIGIDLTAGQQISYLEALGVKVENGYVYAPSFRADIEQEADVAEEVARLYGFENIGDRALTGEARGSLTKEQKFEELITGLMLSEGFSEIITYSFISKKAYDKIKLPEESPLRESVEIMNPLGEDTSVMRTTALPSMLEVLSKNYNNRNLSAALYELATTYTNKGAEELPEHKRTLVLGMYGAGADFYGLKGTVEAVLENAGIKDFDVAAVKDNPSYHPGRTAEITKGGKRISVLGEIHPAVSENYELRVKVYAAEIDFETLSELRNLEKLYKPLPKYPAVTRDLALICDKGCTVLKLSRIISEAAGNTLEDISLFDIYEGEQVESGKKSAAFSLKFRSAEKTLTDEEVDAAIGRALAALAVGGIGLRK